MTRSSPCHPVFIGLLILKRCLNAHQRWGYPVALSETRGRADFSPMNLYTRGCLNNRPGHWGIGLITGNIDRFQYRS